VTIEVRFPIRIEPRYALAVDEWADTRDWLDLPGPNWFSGAEIYRRFVAEVTGPAVAVELGA
jgi:hypothetical protein